MTQRTRYFLVGSALVVVVGLGAGVVAYYTGSLPLRASAIGPAELVYMPGDVSVVAYANVRAVMNSEFRQRLQQALPTGAARDQLLAETGIDVERDIDTVVAGSASLDAGMGDSVVFLRGRFDGKHIEKLATDHGATAEEYGGKRLLVLHDGPARGAASPQDAVPSIAFLEPGLIAMGTPVSVKRAIDASTGRTDVTKNTELMAFVAGVQDTGNAWIVGRVGTVADRVGVPQQFGDQLSAIQWFAVSAKIDRGVSGSLRAQARDEKSGEELRATVNGLLAAGKLMAGKDPTVTAMLTSVQASGAGKNVEVSFVVPAEILALMNAMPASRGMGPGGRGAGAGEMGPPKRPIQ